MSEPYPEENARFLKENGVTHHQIGMPGNKETCITPVPDEKITAALRVILDRRNHPILIHCNKGKVRRYTSLSAFCFFFFLFSFCFSFFCFLFFLFLFFLSCIPLPLLYCFFSDLSQHRTGSVVGCLRRLQAWSVPGAIKEYRRFAGTKSRAHDQMKIETYELEACWELAREHGWIPSTLPIESDDEEADAPLSIIPAAIKAQ